MDVARRQPDKAMFPRTIGVRRAKHTGARRSSSSRMSLRLIIKKCTNLRNRPVTFPITRTCSIAVIDRTVQIPVALVNLDTVALRAHSIIASLVPGYGKCGVLPNAGVEALLCTFCDVLAYWRVRGNQLAKVFITEQGYLSDCPVSVQVGGTTAVAAGSGVWSGLVVGYGN